MLMLEREPNATTDVVEPLIRLRGVCKNYHTPAGDVPALKGVDLDVYPGESLGIVGRSGAGKSTLINMISGVDRVTTGEVWVAGVAVHALSEDRLAIWRGRTLGIVYQSFQLLPMLSLLDNIMLPMDFCGLYRPGVSAKRAMELLREVGLEEHVHKRPSAISGGQQQRVAIARALANDPPILLADEPIGSLDSATADDVLALFERLVANGKTVLMVTHDHALIPHFSRLARIHDGRLEHGARESANAV